MPPKKPSKPNPDTPKSSRVTRSRQASPNGPPVGLFSVDEELERERQAVSATGPEHQANTSTGSNSRVWVTDFEELTDEVFASRIAAPRAQPTSPIAGTSRSRPRLWFADEEELEAEAFARGVDTASTHRTLPLPDPGTLPPLILPDHYSLTGLGIPGFDTQDFESSQFFQTANMSQQGDGTDPMVVIQQIMQQNAQLMQVMAESMRQQKEDREAAQAQRIADATAQETLRQAERAQFLVDEGTRERERARLRQVDIDNHINDRRASEDAILMLANQVKLLAATGPAAPRASHIKLPSFDIYKDQDTFPQWRARYALHLKAHHISIIMDDDLRKERALTELTAALSNDTLTWIANRDLTDEDRKDPEALIASFEAYIKESTNPLVTVVELFTMKRHALESADKLHARINEKLNKVDFSVIKDIRDYFGMTATIIANDPALRKQMYLDKVDTYAKAHAAVKADEQATSHSKMVDAATRSSSTSATINAVSSYRRGQNRTNQQNASTANQSQRDGFSGNNAQSSSSYSRGGSQRENGNGYRGNQNRGSSNRGGYQSQGRGGNASGSSSCSRPPSPDRSQSRDRGRSETRNNNRDQSRSYSTSSKAESGNCEGCSQSGHIRKDCWMNNKTCYNGGQTGHISPRCTQPPQSQSASGGRHFFSKAPWAAS